MKFLSQYWFLVALTACFLTGVLLHVPLAPMAAQAELRDGVIALCMFLMALPLEAEAIWSTLRKPAAVMLAVLVSFGLLPLVAWGASSLLRPEYAGGLLVAAVTPCTMASATVWTRRAGGNDIAATVVTVVTNMVCFFVTPGWLWLLTGTDARDMAQPLAMVARLAVTVVLPVIVAQLLRRGKIVAEFSRQGKHTLGLASQICILWMVMVGAVKTGEKLAGENGSGQSILDLVSMIVIVLALHFLMFHVGLYLSRWLGLTRSDQIAVAFAGSQKTLMVGMNVSILQGFSVLPMITWHVGQLFIDTLLADWLQRQNRRSSPLPSDTPA